jgi:hypothetical protein
VVEIPLGDDETMVSTSMGDGLMNTIPTGSNGLIAFTFSFV